ncbi:hypothetical protein [Ramlibacter sp.]|uniref:hypothetical protein n=1 Tax=Ramlibacter sp. TaxID=1917967 RepID=UPI0017C69C3A|nr:hypothetical protein [Ramlibacter sp.]MBA2675447.1 hypothetical protein [Ramlibacter sp.]
MSILERARSDSVAGAAKAFQVSKQSIYLWRKRYDVLSPAQVRLLKEHDREHARLVKLLADRKAEIDLLSALLSKANRKQ